MPQSLNVVEHPVLADRLTVLRDRETPHPRFRQALSEAAAIMAVEVAKELEVRQVEIRTPLEVTAGVRLRVGCLHRLPERDILPSQYLYADWHQ